MLGTCIQSVMASLLSACLLAGMLHMMYLQTCALRSVLGMLLVQVQRGPGDYRGIFST